MGNAALGRIGIALESLTAGNQGMVLLLGPTLVSALPASLTTQPNGVAGQSIWSGMRLYIEITGNTATGTITVTGKDFTQAQGALTETTNTIPVAGTGANQGAFYPYTTKAVFSAINASGVTVSGLTGGSVKIWGIQAASKLTPAMLETPDEKNPPFSPQEMRGTLSRNTNIQRLNRVVDIPSFKQTFLPDTCALWLPRSTIGSVPTQVTLPSSPTVLKTTTAVSTFPISLTTQPNTIGPDSLIQLVVTGSSASGVVGVAGTNRFGQTITENVICGVPGAANGNGTFYTQQAFASITALGITLGSGLTSGSVALNGIIGIQETYTVGAAAAGAGDVLQTLAVEQYTGTDALTHPFSYFDEVTLEGSPEKELMVSAKGACQDQMVIGDPTVTPMTNISGNIPFGAIGLPGNVWQPFDIGVSGWAVLFWIDALSGTAGTTAYNQILDYKVVFKNPRKPSWPTTNNPRFQVLYRQQREVQIDVTIDFIDVVQYYAFKNNVKQIVQMQIMSNYLLGTISNTPVYKNWIFTFAAKITAAKRDVSKMEKVEAKFTLMTEYTPTLGYEYQLVNQVQLPANYGA
jgi:hypothetical protein